MKTKFIIAAFFVTFGSAAVAGSGCGYGHDKQVMTCAEGTVWDAQTQTCVTQTTS